MQMQTSQRLLGKGAGSSRPWPGCHEKLLEMPRTPRAGTDTGHYPHIDQRRRDARGYSSSNETRREQFDEDGRAGCGLFKDRQGLRVHSTLRGSMMARIFYIRSPSGHRTGTRAEGVEVWGDWTRQRDGEMEAGRTETQRDQLISLVIR